jgi:hypothetical protein
MIQDQVFQHFDAIFLGWMAALITVTFIALLMKRRWLERACIGVGLVLFATPLLGLMLWVLFFIITH